MKQRRQCLDEAGGRNLTGVKVPDQSNSSDTAERLRFRTWATVAVWLPKEFHPTPPSLAIGNDRTGKGDSHPMNTPRNSSTAGLADLDAVFLGQKGAEALGCLAAVSSIASTLPSSICAVIADENRPKTTRLVHWHSNQFGALRHLYFCRPVDNRWHRHPRSGSAHSTQKPAPGHDHVATTARPCPRSRTRAATLCAFLPPTGPPRRG